MNRWTIIDLQSAIKGNIQLQIKWYSAKYEINQMSENWRIEIHTVKIFNKELEIKSELSILYIYILQGIKPILS